MTAFAPKVSVADNICHKSKMSFWQTEESSLEEALQMALILPRERNPHYQNQNSFIKCFTMYKSCSNFAFILCVFALIVTAAVIVFRPVSNVVYIVLIDTKSHKTFVSNERFLSVALDSSVIANGFHDFNMT